MRFSILLFVLCMTGNALADEVTYRNDIRTLWERKCMACHGEVAPYLAEFDENKE